MRSRLPSSLENPFSITSAEAIPSSDGTAKLRSVADVFLSYARDDRPVAEALAEALTQRGVSVWWDRDMPAGENINAYIERMLTDVRSVVVLWSRKSIGSRWVQAEADYAAEREMLIPILIDDCQPPLGFRQIHSAMLKDWENPDGTVRFNELAAVIAPLVGANPLPPADMPDFEANWHRKRSAS